MNRVDSKNGRTDPATKQQIARSHGHYRQEMSAKYTIRRIDAQLSTINFI